jgi:hypothetical protein
VTRKRSITAVRHYVKPDQKLIRAEALRFNLPTENLVAVLAAFGSLPASGQCELLNQVYFALGRYGFRTKTNRVVTPSEQRNRLKMIEATARKLLKLLGVNCNKVAPPWFWENSPDRSPWERLRIFGTPDAKGIAVLMRLAAAGINHRDVDSVNAELAVASNRMAEAAISLLCLRSQARLAEHNIKTREGWGGSRNRPTPKGALMRDAITIYARLRKQYPDSGNKPGYGEPMLKFIRAVAALACASVTDDEIEEVWRVRHSN